MYGLFVFFFKQKTAYVMRISDWSSDVCSSDLTIKTDAVVSNLEYDPARKRVTGVRYVDAKTGQAELVKADLVFLCASAMASVQILMNSRAPGSDRRWFDTSGTLGHYVMEHIFRPGVSGDIPGLHRKSRLQGQSVPVRV